MISFRKKFKVGDKIEIVSFPRIGDGADGFAGTVGVVEAIDYEEKFTIGKGSITLKLEGGASFVGCGINRMIAKKI